MKHVWVNCADLRLHRLDDLRVRVAERRDGDARAEVDERVAVGVDDDAAAGGDGVDRRGVADARGDGSGLAGEQLLRARTGDAGDQATLLRQGRAAERRCGDGVGACSWWASVGAPEQLDTRPAVHSRYASCTGRYTSEARMDAARDPDPARAARAARPAARARRGRSEPTLGQRSDRAVRWVHSSDLADPTPFLSEGLVLLTTGTQFPDGDDAPDVVPRVRAAASRARGVVGLGFGTEVVRDGIPPALVDACRDERMPLFEVPYRTPFIAVARANAEAIAAEAYARRSWALAAQRAIALAALRPDGLGATLAELARQLDTWVGMFDAAGELAREHPVGALDADAAAALQRRGDGRAAPRGAGGLVAAHRRHAVHAADARPRRAPARRDRDRRRRPRPGGSRRRHRRHRDGGARPRAAAGPRPRARRAARRPGAVAAQRRSRARPADRRATCGGRFRPRR